LGAAGLLSADLLWQRAPMVLGAGVLSLRVETPPSQAAWSGRAATGSGDAAIWRSHTIVCAAGTPLGSGDAHIVT